MEGPCLLNLFCLTPWSCIWHKIFDMFAELMNEWGITTIIRLLLSVGSLKTYQVAMPFSLMTQHVVLISLYNDHIAFLHLLSYVDKQKDFINKALKIRHFYLHVFAYILNITTLSHGFILFNIKLHITFERLEFFLITDLATHILILIIIEARTFLPKTTSLLLVSHIYNLFTFPLYCIYSL